MSSDGSQLRNLTHNHALEINSPEWSPDGKTILFSGSGHTTLPDLYTNQSLAIASLLFQSALLMGIALTLIKHWHLPFGALTLLFTLNGLLMSVFHDQYLSALSMLGAGLIADVLLIWLKPSTERRERFWPRPRHAMYASLLSSQGCAAWRSHCLAATFYGWC